MGTWGGCLYAMRAINAGYVGYAGWNTVSWLDTDNGMAMENGMVFGFGFRDSCDSLATLHF